jgi:hypothetical protein
MATARGNPLRGAASQSAPAMRREAVDISSADWTPTRSNLFRGIWVSATGNVVSKDADGVTTTTNNVPVGLFSIGGTTIVKLLTTATIDWAALDN